MSVIVNNIGIESLSQQKLRCPAPYHNLVFEGVLGSHSLFDVTCAHHFWFHFLNSLWNITTQSSYIQQVITPLFKQVFYLSRLCLVNKHCFTCNVEWTMYGHAAQFTKEQEAKLQSSALQAFHQKTTLHLLHCTHCMA